MASVNRGKARSKWVIVQARTSAPHCDRRRTLRRGGALVLVLSTAYVCRLIWVRHGSGQQSLHRPSQHRMAIVGPSLLHRIS